VANPLFAELGGGFLLGLPVSVIMAAVLFGLVALLTRRTALGMLIESVGINPTAARLAGVRARGITLSVYVFVAVCACVAGLMISRTSRGADANNAGLWIELDAILAVVIGGTLLSGGRFSIVGTLVGALVLQTLTTTVYTAGIAPEVTLVFNAIVIIAVCLLQSPRTRALLRRRRHAEPTGSSTYRRTAPDVTAPGVCRQLVTQPARHGPVVSRSVLGAAQASNALMSSAFSAEPNTAPSSITPVNSSAFRLARASTFSSIVSLAMRRYTMTLRVCPMRCVRSTACASVAGFHQGSSRKQ